jgi:hypothetical protein
MILDAELAKPSISQIDLDLGADRRGDSAEFSYESLLSCCVIFQHPS